MTLRAPLPLQRPPESWRRVFASPFIALLIASAGCTGSHPAVVAPAQGDLVFAIDRADNVPAGSLYLKPLPGRLLGGAVDSELFRSRPGATRLRIPVDLLVARLDTHALRTRVDRFNPGELSRPRNLGIARIGTFYEPATNVPGCRNFRSGLRLETPAGVMLVYVDRAGSVRGTRYLEPYIMDYRLEFPAAGIYAVAARSHGLVVTQRVVDLPEQVPVSVRRASCES